MMDLTLTVDDLSDLIDYHAVAGVEASTGAGGRPVLVFDRFMVRYPDSLDDAEAEVLSWLHGEDYHLWGGH